MILQALKNYYDRLRNDANADLPRFGFSSEKIHFALVIDCDGNLVQVRDLRDVQGKRRTPKSLVVPQPVKRTLRIASNFLWDNSSYVLGADAKGKPERAAQAFEAFKCLHHSVGGGSDDEGMLAVLRFIDRWEPASAVALDKWEEIAGANLVFQLDGERGFVHERPALIELWGRTVQETIEDPLGMCLVTGQRSPIKRLHASIKGVKGAQTRGGDIVSFNLPAFCSYGKDQGFNAPVSHKAEFNYTTALNHLLRPDSRQKIQIADTTTVFWTERPSPVETFMGLVLDPSATEAADSRDVHLYLDAVRRGRMPDDIDGHMQFYILGLAPNATRLAVRFWYAGTVEEISRNIGQHFNDLRIARSRDTDPEFPGIGQLLLQTAAQGKKDNIPPLLGGEVMRSILTGGPYPRSLLSSIIVRIRADQKINYLRAAMIKACLVRQSRITNQRKEIAMVLDPENTNIAYVLGRLFAVLERAQKDAVPGANTTIKDRFFGAASSTPRTVFPQLVRLAQHHIEKAEFGHVRDKQIEEIMDKISEFPPHLSLDDQGLFAIGYYHQRADFFKKTSQE